MDEEPKIIIGPMLTKIQAYLKTYGLTEFKEFLQKTFDIEDMAELVQYFVVMKQADRRLPTSAKFNPKD